MMNKRFAVIFLFFLLTTPHAVQAQDATAYVGLKLGGSFMSFNDGKWTSDVGGDVTYNYDANKDDIVFAGGITLGYDFKSHFRAELEYLYRTQFDHDQCPTKIDRAWNVKTGLDSQTIMINLFYDFRNSTAFTPFVILGAGLAVHKTENTVEPIGLVPDYTGRDVTETEFAWTAGLGVAYTFTENCVIDLTYRYIDMGQARYENYSPGYDEANTVADMHAQEFLIGIRYKFRL